MIAPALSRRLGAAMGSHVLTVDERSQLIEAVEAPGVTTFDDLPRPVQALVVQIEDRPVL